MNIHRSRMLRSAILGSSALAMTITVIGCSSGSSSTSATVSSADVTISGTLNSTSSMMSTLSSRGLDSTEALLTRMSSRAASTASTIYCVTFSSSPSAGIGAIGSSGEFSLTIANAAGKMIGCFVRDASNLPIGTIVFKDSTKKSMSGEDAGNDGLTLSGTVNLGTIIFDTATGIAEVDVSTITTSSGTPPSLITNVGSDAFDPTGTWTMAQYDGELPEGFDGVSPSCGGMGDGPCAGMTLYLKRVAGTDQTSGFSRYGMMVWQTETAFQDCGSSLPDSFANILSSSGIDFRGSDVNEGPFIFTPSVSVGGSTVNLTDDWKPANATINWVEGNCFPGSYQGRNVFICEDPATTPLFGVKKVVQLGGGCSDSSGTPIKLEGGVTWGSSTPPQISSAGIRTRSMSGSYNSSPITCSFQEIWLNASDQVIMTAESESHRFDWSSANTPPSKGNNVPGSCSAAVTAGDSCECYGTDGTNSERRRLAALRCYAQAYYNMGVEQAIRQSNTGCYRDVRTNWSATTPSEFVLDTGMKKPSSMFVGNELIYSDANTAKLYDRQTEYRGVQVESDSGSNWIPCRVENLTSLSFNKINDNKILVTFAQNTKNASVDQDACVAEFGEGRLEQFMFYLVK